MNFEFNDEQRIFRDSCRKILQDKCNFNERGALIAKGSFDLERWKAYADYGWMMLSVPETRGGLGMSEVEYCLLMEELGRSLCVEPVWAIAGVSARLLSLIEPTARVDELLEGLMAGTRLPVLAHSEADTHSVLAGISTTAIPQGAGRWKVSGEKPLVFAGNIADSYIVSARTARDSNATEGISLFLVDPAADGVHRRDVRLIDNRWCAHLVLDGVEVDENDLVGPLNHAFPLLDKTVSHAILGICAEAIGLMDSSLWLTRDYLKTRKQFGTELASFQALQHRMSDMLIELELSRSALYRCISLINADAETRNAAISALKYQIGHSGRFVCGQAIQLHGGIGVTDEYIVGHYFKRMTLIDNAFGNGHAHLEHLASIERQAA